MSIEERYLSGLTAVQFPDAPVAEQMPAEPSLDGVQLAMGGNAAGRKSDRTMTDVPQALLDTGAGVVRGAVAQTLGLPGDMEMLFNGLKGVFTKPEDQGRLQAFFQGMQEKTTLPTTERMGEILPPVVPAGAADSANRTHNASIGQAFGEVAPLPGAIEAGTAAVKYGAKTLGPKAAEMAVQAAEKTGMPVRGLNIIEDSLTSKGAQLAPNIEVPAAGDITKPAFKKWFSNSAVTDNSGAPIVVYHGSPDLRFLNEDGSFFHDE